MPLHVRKEIRGNVVEVHLTGKLGARITKNLFPTRYD
jgi:hypothetical protein